MGAGGGYRYPHEHGGWVDQRYLPPELDNRDYFGPLAGREAELHRLLADHKRSDRK
jgi:putative ATPase